MWPRIVNAALGLWLMAAPALLDYGGAARTNDRIVGPVAASFAVIAIWEVTRPLRWANVALGVWLLVAPWLPGYDPVPLLNSLAVGACLITFGWIRGPIRHRLGGGWSALLPGRGSQTARTQEVEVSGGSRH